MNLKTIHLILLVLLLTINSTFISAQKTKSFKPEFSFGLSGGTLFSEIDFVPRVAQTSHNGISIGVSSKYVSEKHLGIIAELNFSQRGWAEDFIDINTDFMYSRTMNFLELPLLTHIYFGDKVKFIFNIGPQVSYMLSDKAEMNSALSEYLNDYPNINPDGPPIGIQYKAIDNKFDYGLLGGLGIEFSTPLGDFDLEGRYYFGLGDSFINDKSSSTNFSRSAHRYFQGKLTYYFLAF